MSERGQDRCSRVLSLTLLTVVLLVNGCNLTSPLPLPTVTATPLTNTPLPGATLSPLPADTSASSDGWDVIAPGLASRTLTPNGNLFAQLHIVRIDPTQVRFRAHYRPGDPLALSQWQAELVDAAVIVNTNFFEPDNTVLGLLIADSAVYGQSYVNRGGTFAIQNGLPLLRSNITTPYEGEPFEQAIQAFPMLIENSQIVYQTASAERATRRSAIGIDRAGRVLIIATPLFGLSLADLAAVLALDELDLVQAMNLDGGGSTMLAVNPSGYTITSIDPVPAVLAVYPPADIP